MVIETLGFQEMNELDSKVWGPSRYRQPLGLFGIIVVNSLYAFIFVWVAVMFSFTALPFLGDEMELSPRREILKTFMILGVFDLIALWRFAKLHKRWSKVRANKLFLWGLQLCFVAAVGYANFWMLTVVWFWWGR